MSVIITCAVNGSGDHTANPALPTTAKAIAESALDAAKAGAAVLHMHSRDPLTGKPSVVGSDEELATYREVVERIRERNSEVILNLTTGPGGNFVVGDVEPTKAGPGTTLTTTDRRIRHVEELRPDICSLDVGSMDKGDNIYLNAEKHVRASLARIRKIGVRPEFEVFEPGHMMFLRSLIEEGLVDAPPIVQICLGYSWGAPATPESVLYMKNLLPPGAVWIAFGKALNEYPIMAQAVILGGHVRCGLEDTPWIAPGELAPSNAAMIEKAVKLLSCLNTSPATPAEARKIMGLTQARTPVTA